jgi:hypothetical protein
MGTDILDLAVPPATLLPAGDGQDQTQVNSMPIGETVDLLDYGVEIAEPRQLSQLSLNSDEHPALAFTSNAERHLVHYCYEEDLRGYVPCRGSACLLCKIGKKPESRILLPLYDFACDDVRILMVSERRTPHALLPQIQQALAKVKAVGPQLLILSKDGSTKFRVQVRDLPKGVDNGATAIVDFATAVAAGTIRLADVLVSVSDDELRALPWFAKALQLRGV